MRLQSKVLSLLLPLAVLGGGLLLFFSKAAVHAILIESFFARGASELGEISRQIAAGMRSGEEGALLPLLYGAKGKLGASYAMALDAEGKVLGHTNVLEKGKRLSDEATSKALGAEAPLAQELVLDGRPVLDISVPVWELDESFLLAQESGGKTRVGALRVGLPLDDVAATQDAILSRLGFILSITTGVAVILIVLFLRGLLGPVRLLSEATRRIAEGRYGESVPVRSRDELGVLARHFNDMSQVLASTTVSKEHLDSVLQSIADILIVTDGEGAIRIVNHAALEALGYAREDLLRYPLAVLLRNDDAREGREEDPVRRVGEFKLRALLSGRSIKGVEVTLWTKSGEKLPVLLSGAALHGGDGSAQGLVLVAKDLSERKRMEMMLVQSEKLSAVGQLAAGVAHEINNPLGIILGFAQSAAKRLRETDALCLPIKSIEREALRCKNLVQNLLTFSRQSKARMEVFDLNEAVASTLSIIEAQARVKSVEILRDFGALDPLFGDKNQIQQVLVNLCNNAIDAMPKGGRIAVRTRREGQDGEARTVLEVEDDGLGIPAEIQDKVFNPFFTTKEVGKGTGLGLSLVHEIVQRHGGTIDLKSEAGKGTLFVITLPLAAAGGRSDAGTA